MKFFPTVNNHFYRIDLIEYIKPIDHDTCRVFLRFKDMSWLEVVAGLSADDLMHHAATPAHGGLL